MTSGPYADWMSSPQFSGTRRYAEALADAPAFPAGIEGDWTVAKADALDQHRSEWRSEFGPRTPDGTVHPDARRRQRSGTQVPYDRDFVRANLNSAQMDEVDPKFLHGIQQGVHARGVEYYLSDEYNRTGTTFEQLKGNVPTEGNRYPTVYKREDGMNVLLSGHHRAAAALAQGRPLIARTLRGPVPEGRA